MQETNTRISRQETYVPDRWTRFLWWLAAVEKELIRDCTIDRNRYAIVGMTVLATWIFATLAWTYFFSAVTSNVFVTVLMGLCMGGIILTIDRALIKGISKTNKRKTLPLVFRGSLALVIGLFMAQPALLYLFDKEIHVQVSLDNEQRKREKRSRQDSVYALQKNEWLTRKNNLQSQLSGKYAEVQTARENFIAETDGTGGSKKIGMKDIAQAKQKEYIKLDGEYALMQATLQPQLNAMDSALNNLETNIRKEQTAFESLLNDGFITRIEALNHLVQNNTAVAFRYYLLVCILMLIELMPVISKTMLPYGSYEEKVKLREAMETTLAQHNHQRELQLKETYNQSAFEQDSFFIKSFFKEAEEERKIKMRTQLQIWREEETKSFSSTWDDMKRDLLTKQEN